VAGETFTINLTVEQFTALAAQIKQQPSFTDAMLISGRTPERFGVVLNYFVTRDLNGGAVVIFTVVKRPGLISVKTIQGRVLKMMGVQA